MPRISQYSAPVIIEQTSSVGNARRLTKVPLFRNSDNIYDEDWLQELIHNNPLLLPVEELEPAFFPLFPVCRELATSAGVLDNLFVSENGSLTLVECKLWKNPEARREVVGQILDYAKDISAWSYDELLSAVQHATGKTGNVLFDLISRHVDDLDEAQFNDLVSRNLRLGQFLLLIVGDGIREDVENIATYLQKHAGLNFSFALVELPIFNLPDDRGILVQPRVLARTATIERFIIRIADGIAHAEVLSETPADDKSIRKRTSSPTLSEDQFFEKLSQADESLVHILRGFLERLALHEVIPTYGSSSLKLHWLVNDKKMFFGSILTNGSINTSPCNWVPGGIGRIDIGHSYLQKLANLVPGASVKETPNETEWRIVKGSKGVYFKDTIQYLDEWIELINETKAIIIEAME